MTEKPDWYNDLDLEPQEAFVSFKNELTHFITFLNEGKKGTSDLKDDKGEIYKTIPCVNFNVMESGEAKTFNPIAKNLIGELKNLFPLTNKTFRIELHKGRLDVDNTYSVQEFQE